MDLIKNSPIKIMYAEDDDADRMLLKEALVEAEINSDLETVTNGEALIKDLSKTDPDIIFLDLNIPRKNGKECLHEIRSNNKFKDIPVIIFSTCSFEEDVNDTYADGANMYVTKPISFKSHVEILKKIFSINWRKKLLKHDKKEFLLCLQ